MKPLQQLREEFASAVGIAVGADAPDADRLCDACVDLLSVDGASISLLHEGVTWGTIGSSGELSRQLDELQFTFGEGPCLDAINGSQPVLVPDLSADETRWPAFASAVVRLGIRAVFAAPVPVEGALVGALDLFRHRPGGLDDTQLGGFLIAAEMAGAPLLAHISAIIEWDTVGPGLDAPLVRAWERVEIYQATGMIMAQLDIGPEEALLRLRGHAFGTGMTASAVAWQIIDRQLRLDDDTSAIPGTDSPGGVDE